MKSVTPEDFTELQKIARAYCRAIDSTRFRKRMDGSATVARNGINLFGTDDVSDDVTQDAVLIFAKRLREIADKYKAAALWVTTREPSAWQYVRRDGETIVATRHTIQYWAVRDAAARNGYKAGRLRSEQGFFDRATESSMSGLSEAIFRSAWGDGSEYPTLRSVLEFAENADDLGRAGVMGKAAQQLFGGPRNSSSKVQRTKDAALREWRCLTASLDAVRADLVHSEVLPSGVD